MSLSKKTRFEVFKRDDFTCQYCGRKTPTVVLEVDHIVPRVEGGGDEIENLLTSCFDCNRGKGGIPLTDITAVVDVGQRARLIAEREEQLRAYNDALREKREREDADFAEVWNYWFELWQTDTLEPWYLPYENVLRKYIRVLPLEEIRDAMDIAIRNVGHKSAAKRYLAGVLRRKLAEHEGRLKQCTVCGKFIELDPGQDASLEWHHNACVEEETG